MFVSCKSCFLSLRQADHSSRGSPTECVVSECDREASIMRRPWPNKGCCANGKKKYSHWDRFFSKYFCFRLVSNISLTSRTH
jgi:hypothetical protein